MDEHLHEMNMKLSEIDKEISYLRIRIKTTKEDYRNCDWFHQENRKIYAERLVEMDSKLTYLIGFKEFLGFKIRLDSFLLDISPDVKVFGNEIEEIAGLKAGDVFVVGNKTIGLKWENKKYYLYNSKEGASCKWDGISLEEAYEEARHRVANNHITRALEPRNRGNVSVTKEDLEVAGISLDSRGNFERDGIIFKAYCRDNEYYFIDRQTIIKRTKKEIERVSKEINQIDKEYYGTRNWETEKQNKLLCEMRKLSKYLKFLKVKEKIENEFDKSHNWYDLFPEDFDNVGLTEDDIIEIDGNSYSFSCKMTDCPWEGYKIVYAGSDNPTVEWDAPTLEETYHNARYRMAYNHVQKAIDSAFGGKWFCASREDLEICLNSDALDVIDKRHEILFNFSSSKKGDGEYEHHFSGIYKRSNLECMTTTSIREWYNNLNGFMLELCANNEGYFFRKFDVKDYLQQRHPSYDERIREISIPGLYEEDYTVATKLYYLGQRNVRRNRNN